MQILNLNLLNAKEITRKAGKGFLKTLHTVCTYFESIKYLSPSIYLFELSINPTVLILCNFHFLKDIYTWLKVILP